MCPVGNKLDVYKSQAKENVVERWEAEKIPALLGVLLPQVKPSNYIYF